MPNAIKYSVSTQTLALKKGNYWIGTGDVSKGPTSTTDYWNGITPPSGGYTIYLNKASQGPSIYVAANNAGLISLTNSIAGASYTTAEECLVYFAGQTDKMVFNIDYESIVTDGLVFTMDAGFTPSYPATGSTWYDLGGNGYNGTLTNGPTFNSSDGGSIVFDGTDDLVSVGSLSQINSATSLTLCFWAKKSSSTSNMDIGSQVTSNTNGIWLLWYSDSIIYFSPRNGSFTSVTYSLPYNSNWNYFVGVYTNSTGTIYVNGSSVASGSGMPSSLSSTAGNDFQIGNLRNLFPARGNISNVQVYNRALTASEILQNYNAQKGRFPLLLDLYPSAAAAYSVRKLRNAYTGSAIRVRRSSDNTEQDIGFRDGNLDTSALTTFVGANNGFVTTFYDQSGNARNATQATAANQPQIVDSGTILTQGGKPIMKFTSSSQVLNTPSFSLSANRTYVMTLYNVTNALASYKVYLGAQAAGSDNLVNGLNGQFASSNIVRSWIGSGTANNVVGINPTANNAYFLLGAYVQGSVQQQHYRNGALNAQNTSLTISPTTNSQVNSIMFNAANGSDIRTNEAIIWDSYQSTNRTGIESNINAYYAIY